MKITGLFPASAIAVAAAIAATQSVSAQKQYDPGASDTEINRQYHALKEPRSFGRRRNKRIKKGGNLSETNRKEPIKQAQAHDVREEVEY